MLLARSPSYWCLSRASPCSVQHHQRYGSGGEHGLAIGAFVLLGIALLIALGFELVNGFHDTAIVVATVIYTHSCRRWWP